MDPLRQAPYFALDHEARRQIRETRSTVLEHLAHEPDDLQALVLADVLAEIDPDRDPQLAAHRTRFHATRAGDWKVRARALGIDALLYRLATGLAEARIGTAAVPVLEHHATEISEARASEVAPGLIDASCIPDALATHPAVEIAYHPSGHLARVAVHVDELHDGVLELAPEPGSGHYRIVEKRGGYGTMIAEDYRNGRVVTTLNTPWHDGTESSAKKSWTRWVEENVADLARLATTAPRRARARRRSRA